MLSSLFMPSEIIITRCKVDETSIKLLPFGFKTILYGYESNIILFLFVLIFLNQLARFLKGYVPEFLMVFLTLLYFGFIGFQLYFNTGNLHIGFYFCLLSSAYILALNLKHRFGKNRPIQ
jgi:hypothetical protein